jgi:hypothetical protein
MDRMSPQNPNKPVTALRESMSSRLPLALTSGFRIQLQLDQQAVPYKLDPVSLTGKYK